MELVLLLVQLVFMEMFWLALVFFFFFFVWFYYLFIYDIFFKKKHIILACDPNCLTCAGPKINDCRSCSQGLYSAQEGRCGQTCPLLTYPDPEHHLCANCATGCLTCDDGISIFNNLLFFFFSHLVLFFSYYL